MKKCSLTAFLSFLLLLCPLCVFGAAESTGVFGSSFSELICSPVISGILIAVGLGCVFIEILIPGFGIFGVLGLVSFFLYFAGHIAADGFAWVGLLIFGAGMLLLMIEAFVLTGFGFSGLFGIAAIFGSVILLSSSLVEGVITVLVAVVVLVIIMVVSYRFMKKRKIIHKFILKDRTDTESGFTAPNMDNEGYIGREGLTVTALRPAGDVKIDGNRIDVISEGDFIDSGVKVRVIGLDGTRIVVRAVEDIVEEK